VGSDSRVERSEKKYSLGLATIEGETTMLSRKVGHPALGNSAPYPEERRRSAYVAKRCGHGFKSRS
jgi:hypothetical protein